MVAEGTPGKYLLWATRPGILRPVAESYATRATVDARSDALRADGYTVEVTTPKLRKGD
jgi:hypothetical protein